MNEIIKRKKDEGFTLIELMIVIAVIGILAIVLVPKVGTIKTQAKGAGIDTNTRMVQGYIQSRINSWNNSSITPNNASIASDIYTAFNTATNPNSQDQIANPFDSSKKGAAQGSVAGSPSNIAVYVDTTGSGNDVTTLNATSTAGTIVVSPYLNGSPTAVQYVMIYAHDVNGALIADKTIKITP